MINIYYGDETRVSKIKKDFQNAKSFDNLEDFLSVCFQNSLFVDSSALILRDVENIKNLSFLLKIPKNREIVLSVSDDKGTFLKNLPKDISYKKVECRRDNNLLSKEIMDRFNISFRDAYKISSMIDGNLDNELSKLENLFYKKEFSLDEAEKVLFVSKDVDLFNALDQLIAGKKELSLKLGSKDAISFVFSFIKIVDLITKIKVLDLKSVTYDIFVKDVFPKYKKILPHPYFVFKNIKVANKISMDKLKKLIVLSIFSERKVKSGISPEIVVLDIVAAF